MELTILERLILLSILPQEGNFTTLKIVRQLRENLSFSEEEHKVLQFKQNGDALLWDQTNIGIKDITLGEKATDIIVESLKKLDDTNKLTEQHFSVYEKFMIPKGKEE
jgi:hypothetical protein